MLHLPNELIGTFLRYLDYRDILSWSKVSRFTRNFIQHDAGLQFKIVIGIDGLRDTSMDMSFVSKINRIRDLRRRWRTLSWQGRHQQPVEGECHAYELTDGLYLQLSPEGTLFVLKLPSSLDPTPEVLCNSKLDFRPADMALDPSQDIIAFVKVEAPSALVEPSGRRLLSLSVSPLSSQLAGRGWNQRTLSFEVSEAAIWENTVHRASTHLVGDVVGVFVATSDLSSRLMIWNWKTGVVVVDSDREECLPKDPWSLSFVDSTTYYTTSVRNHGAIDLYTFDPSGKNTGSVHRCTLLFPQLQPNVFLYIVKSHCEAPLTRSSSRSFSSSAGNQMHVLHLTYLALTAWDRPTYTLFVPSSLLIHHASGQNAIIPWNDWGPSGTRLMEVDGSYHWLRYVYGPRVICPPTDGTIGAIRVLDFNVQQSQPHGFSFDSKLEQMLYTTPTVISRHDGVFTNDVKSQLPYISTTIRFADHTEFGAYMIDQERIMGLTVAGVSGERITHLTIFTL